MSEPQISDPALPPLSPERISQIENLLKPKGFSYDNLSEAEITPNGLYEIIYSFIVKNYPSFFLLAMDGVSDNPNNQLQRFIIAMNNIQQISFERLNLIDQPERTRTQSYINNFSGFGEGNNALNNILFTYKEHFGNISIWNITSVQQLHLSDEVVRKEPFGPQIDTLNYFLPELNILFLDNRITLLIPCHDKFMKQNNETFLSSPNFSLQDFIEPLVFIRPWGNNDGFSDADSDDDSDGDGDENLEPMGTVTARAGAIAARENNDRLIQEARDRITELQLRITNIEGQPPPRGPVATANRQRQIQLIRTQITNTENQIRRLQYINRSLNQRLDQTMMLQNEAIFQRLQREAEEDARLRDEQKAAEDATRLQAERGRQERLQAAEARQAQAQAAAAAGTSESEEDGDNEEGVVIRSLFDEDDDY